MKKIFITLLFLTILSSLGFSQIKRQFEDTKQNGRTVVVKEEGITDQQILQQQFGDVRPGKVIRITMDKPPRTKTLKPKVVKTKPPKSKVTPKPTPKKKVVKTPKGKPQEVTPPPPPRPQKYFGVGTSRKYKMKKKKLKRKKRFNPKKQRRCYGF